ncbi:hypothetical protein, partial [Pseudomonas viridiflava]|uniref:hypothetical protein n=1 Tax=Pseudomonas viridiflava TaxID=33069 RepID=UPI001981E000
QEQYLTKLLARLLKSTNRRFAQDQEAHTGQRGVSMIAWRRQCLSKTMDDHVNTSTLYDEGTS